MFLHTSFLVRGVISAASYYLTSFGQPLFLQNVRLHFFVFICTLFLFYSFIFIFCVHFIF